MVSFTKIATLLVSSAAVAAAVSADSDVEHRDLQNYNVYAFMCDDDYKEIDDKRPLEGAEPFRVCLRTSETTANAGVTIMKINFFRFYKPQSEGKTLTQNAIDAGAPANDVSFLDCPGGDEHCSFKTTLRDAYYYEDGQVEGIGSVALQFGSRRNLLRGGGDDRDLQEFAGLVAVNFYFDIEDGMNKPKIETQKQNFKDFWTNQTDQVQGLFIGAILVAFLLFCCICGGCVLWQRCCADIGASWVKREVDEEDEIHVMPPMGVDGKGTDGDDQSETYSLDDEDVVPSEDEEEESSEDESTRRYDVPQSYNSRMLGDNTTISSSRSVRTGKSQVGEGALVMYGSSQSEQSTRSERSNSRRSRTSQSEQTEQSSRRSRTSQSEQTEQSSRRSRQ